jgi:C4-dicarboxylate-specific signal transduction histidine kinase
LIKADPPDVDLLKAILADIRRDDERASEVIRRLSALLRKGPLAFQLIDVNDVVRETSRILAAEAAARGLVLTMDLDPRTLLVRADPVHLQQVLLNLAMNGMDAMLNTNPTKPRLGIRTALIRDSTVEVSVSDSGSGIPDDKLDEIFKPFFTTKPAGMGLGLSISRDIIQIFGGEIRAENRTAGGAVFSFNLPLAVGARRE